MKLDTDGFRGAHYLNLQFRVRSGRSLLPGLLSAKECTFIAGGVPPFNLPLYLTSAFLSCPGKQRLDPGFVAHVSYSRFWRDGNLLSCCLFWAYFLFFFKTIWNTCPCACLLMCCEVSLLNAHLTMEFPCVSSTLKGSFTIPFSSTRRKITVSHVLLSSRLSQIVNIHYPGEFKMLPEYCFNFHMSSSHWRKTPLICYMYPLVSLSVIFHVSPFIFSMDSFFYWFIFF